MLQLKSKIICRSIIPIVDIDTNPEPDTIYLDKKSVAVYEVGSNILIMTPLYEYCKPTSDEDKMALLLYVLNSPYSTKLAEELGKHTNSCFLADSIGKCGFFIVNPKTLKELDITRDMKDDEIINRAFSSRNIQSPLYYTDTIIYY